MLNASVAKIYLCLDPTDMRKSFDTLAALVSEHLQGDPQSGTWFVFRGKQGNRLKILYWDRDGYAVWQKRLEQGTFEFPKVIGEAAGEGLVGLDLAGRCRQAQFARAGAPQPGAVDDALSGGFPGGVDRMVVEPHFEFVGEARPAGDVLTFG